MVKRQDLSLDFKARRLFGFQGEKAFHVFDVCREHTQKTRGRFVRAKLIFVAAELHVSCSCGNAVAMMMMCGLMFSDVGLTYQVQNVVAMVG